MNRRLPSERYQSLEVRELMEESLEVLRTYRHDLMNQVQLLQAYSQMKKYDRLQDPIQLLVAEAQRHTEWSSFPSSMISYVVLSRDISYPMLKLHASYEVVEDPTPEAERRAAQLLAHLLDVLGDLSKTVLEPIELDVWIVSFRQGYEVGWSLGTLQEESVPSFDWQAWAAKWSTVGVQFVQDEAEEGIEYRATFGMQE